MENTTKEKQETVEQGVFFRHWFSLVFVFALVFSVGATAYRVFASKSYSIEIETVCSPETEACFARDICDTEDGFCEEGDAPTDTEYYKYIERRASAFPAECMRGSMDMPICADLSCLPGESDCKETLCSEETLAEGDVCVGPGYSVPESMEGENEDASNDTVDDETPLEGDDLMERDAGGSDVIDTEIEAEGERELSVEGIAPGISDTGESEQ